MPAVSHEIEYLYRTYGERLRGYFVRHGASRDVADDLTQEVFVKVFRNIESFRGQTDIGVWIWKIAYNVTIDSLRARSSYEQEWTSDGHREHAVIDPKPDADDLLDLQRFEDCVRRGFARLEAEQPERAACLRWAVNDGMSMEQLASVLGRTMGATREYLSQCRKKLSLYLEPCRRLAML